MSLNHLNECGCCAHFYLPGAFSPERQPFRMADGDEAPSFVDLTPRETSRLCNSDRSATDGLYEMIEPARLLVFRRARVMTMQDGAILRDHDVAVRAGRIEAVRPGDSEWPADAIIVEAEGKTLLPGFTDIHAHLYVANWGRAFAPMFVGLDDELGFLLPYDLMLFQLLAAGVTRIEVMAGCADALWMRDAVRSGTLVGPRMRIGSPMVDGPATIHTPLMSYVVGDHAGGLLAAEQIAERGFDFAKPYTNLPLDGFLGLADGCDRLGIRMMGHVSAEAGPERVIERGQQGIAHAAELFYNETGEARTDSARRDRIARMMADAGTWLQATVIVFDRMEWRGGRRPLNAPDIDYMNPGSRLIYAEDSPFVQWSRNNPAKQYLYENTFATSCTVTKAAHQAGVRVLTGTDFPNPYVVEGFSLHEEFEHLTQHCGMSPAETLFATSRLAAIYHDEGPADGMVVEGGIADLVLLDNDPLSDIRATRSIDTVLVDGRALLRRAAIDDGLARIRARFAAMPECTIAQVGADASNPLATTGTRK